MKLLTLGTLPCHGSVPMPVTWLSHSHSAHAALGGCLTSRHPHMHSRRSKQDPHTMRLRCASLQWPCPYACLMTFSHAHSAHAALGGCRQRLHMHPDQAAGVASRTHIHPCACVVPPCHYFVKILSHGDLTLTLTLALPCDVLQTPRARSPWRRGTQRKPCGTCVPHLPTPIPAVRPMVGHDWQGTHCGHTLCN